MWTVFHSRFVGKTFSLQELGKRSEPHFVHIQYRGRALPRDVTERFATSATPQVPPIDWLYFALTIFSCSQKKIC